MIVINYFVEYTVITEETSHTLSNGSISASFPDDGVLSTHEPRLKNSETVGCTDVSSSLNST